MMSLSNFRTWTGTVYWQQALLGGPALLAVLTLSLSWEPHMAVVTTASAFTIAFGAAHALPGRRWWPMIITCLGMASATVLGSIAAEHGWALFALAGVLTACCAALSAWDGDWWWVDLQVVCAFLVASYFPGSVDVGLDAVADRAPSRKHAERPADPVGQPSGSARALKRRECQIPLGARRTGP